MKITPRSLIHVAEEINEKKKKKIYLIKKVFSPNPEPLEGTGR